MATTYHTVLQELYVAYFNRPADPGGLDYWEGVVEAANGDLTAVSAAFAASGEYSDVFEGKTSAQIVTQIYQNLFGHAPDAGGLKFYADALNENRITIDLVVKDIANGAQGSDDTAFNNKVKAAVAFTNALDTAAEKAGYAGEDALVLAKEFIAGVTTDASYAAAVAPANLNAVIAEVVHAGTPFTLITALEALDAANDAKTEFLVTADGDDKAATSATDISIAAAVTAAETAVDGLVAGYAAASPAVAAALLSDKIAANTAALGVSEKAYATALAAADKVEGLSAAIAALTVATDAQDAATKVQSDANVVVAAAEVAYEGYKGGGADITIDPTGTVTGLIELNSDDELVLVAGVTEANNKGITALLNAIIAREAADASVTAAAGVTAEAQFTVDVTDLAPGSADELLAVGQGITLTGDLGATELPTAAQIVAEVAALEAALAATTPGSPEETAAQNALTAFNGLVTTFQTADATNPLAAAVIAAAADVETKQDAIDDLTEAVEDLNDAQAIATELAGLNEAIDFAKGTFTANDYKLPVTLGAANAGTSGNDIFLTAKAATTTLVNFGVAGDDILYVGSGYKLNATGDITKGVNADLEVFFVKSGTSTKVVVETSAFGSSASTPEVLTITLTGVAPEELKFENGIITHV